MEKNTDVEIGHLQSDLDFAISANLQIGEVQLAKIKVEKYTCYHWPLINDLDFAIGKNANCKKRQMLQLAISSVTLLLPPVNMQIWKRVYANMNLAKKQRRKYRCCNWPYTE